MLVFDRRSSINGVESYRETEDIVRVHDMMKRARRYFPVGHLTLLVYLATGLVNANEMVLCIRADGHVAVEVLSTTGRCELMARASDQTAPFLIQADTLRGDTCYCGPCVDMALASIDIPAELPRLQRGVPPAPLAALSCPSAVLTSAQHGIVRTRPSSLHPAVSTRAPLLSVILLI